MWDDWRDAGGNLNRERIDNDIKTLDQESKALYIFTSATLAHTNNKAINKEFNLTFNDLDAVLDHLEKLAIAYGSLLTGRSSNTLIPVVQYDWYAQFKFPWKKASED